MQQSQSTSFDETLEIRGSILTPDKGGTDRAKTDRSLIYDGSLTAIGALLGDSCPTALGVAVVESEEILTLTAIRGAWTMPQGTRFPLSELPSQIIARLFAGAEITGDVNGSEMLFEMFGLTGSGHVTLFPLGIQGTFKGWLICATELPVAPDRGKAIRALANVIGASLQSISTIERKSGDHFGALVQNSSDVITVISSDAIINHQTPSVERVLGYDPATMVGMKFTDIVHPDDVPNLIAFLGQAVDHTGSSALLEECRIRHIEGHWVYCEISISNLLDHPTVQGFVLNSRDISERRWAQDALEKALAQEKEFSQKLRSVDEMKNTFLAAVSHELRTPLTSILGGTITIERMIEAGRNVSDEDVVDMIRRVTRQARKLDELLSDLLDLNRLVRDAFELKTQELDLKALVERVVREVALETEVVVDADEVRASVDKAKIERILDNLIRNAGKYTPPGSKVWVKLRQVEGYVIIAVEDEGDGIPDEMKATVFQPFKRGTQVSTHSPGTGIGLSLVHRFAELHGGAAWVQDREGGGSSFRVMLPQDR